MFLEVSEGTSFLVVAFTSLCSCVSFFEAEFLVCMFPQFWSFP